MGLMDASELVPTSTACPGITDACDALAAVLVADPDFDTALAVADAIDVLSDVHPPLPPLAYPEVGVDAAVGIDRALRALTSAVEEAPTVEEALRAGQAARVLRNLLDFAPARSTAGAPVLP
jgi:hypothetical protein